MIIMKMNFIITILVEDTFIKVNKYPLSWKPHQFQYTFIDKYYIQNNSTLQLQNL